MGSEQLDGIYTFEHISDLIKSHKTEKKLEPEELDKVEKYVKDKKEAIETIPEPSKNDKEKLSKAEALLSVYR